MSKYNLGVLGSIFLPFVLQTLTGWGFSGECSNQIVNTAQNYWPSLVTAAVGVTTHLTNYLNGARTLGGAKV